jgi:hypothetical protein
MWGKIGWCPACGRYWPLEHPGAPPGDDFCLVHLDRTVLMFDPVYKIESITPKACRPPEDWSKRGETTRIILGILRQTTEPMTARKIAVLLIAERSLDQNDEKLARLITKRWLPRRRSAPITWCVGRRAGVSIDKRGERLHAPHSSQHWIPGRRL